ncbi:MAG: hypothetical protein ACP5QN_03285, partial [Minisyncoccia bacterium]
NLKFIQNSPPRADPPSAEKFKIHFFLLRFSFLILRHQCKIATLTRSARSLAMTSENVIASPKPQLSWILG